MGEAKRRGSFEARRAEAVEQRWAAFEEAQRLLDEQKQTDLERLLRMTPEERALERKHRERELRMKLGFLLLAQSFDSSR